MSDPEYDAHKKNSGSGIDDDGEIESPTPNKSYLGDGVYVIHDGYGLVLTAEDGIRATNTIYLEPDVYSALMAYVEKWK